MAKGAGATTKAILSLAVCGVGLAGCGLKEPPSFDPIALQKSEESASRQGRPSPSMPPLPTTLIDIATQPDVDETTQLAGPATRPAATNPHIHLRQETSASTGPAIPEDVIVRMPIQDIIQRSVLHSMEVAVAGFDAAIAKTKVLEAEAKFDPVAFVNAKYEHQDAPFAGQVIQNPIDPSATETLNVERGEVYTLEPGIKQNLPSGGQVSLSYQFQYNYLLPQRFRENPYWDDQLKFQLTQPLLRGAGLEVNSARITVARNDTRVAVLDFRKALEDNVAELEKDYWQLQEAEQEVKIQENLLQQTRGTARILFQQLVQGGAGVSRVQTSQAQAKIRDREAVLIRARARMRDISDDIKRRMNDPQFPVASEAVILPADPPAEVKIEFALPEQVSTALVNRLELGQQDLRISDADVALNVAINNAYPKLDMTSALTLEGIYTAPANAPTTHLGGNFSDTLRSQWETDGHVGWSLGFQFELPLGNREARAVIRRAYLQRLQAIVQYRNLIDQVTLDVTQALREVQTTWNEMGARRQARFAQADQLSAYEDRRANGEALTPNFVQLLLDAQEGLADAEREEALAVASYQLAIARLERAKGTLLRYNNVVLAEDTFKGMER